MVFATTAVWARVLEVRIGHQAVLATGNPVGADEMVLLIIKIELKGDDLNSYVLRSNEILNSIGMGKGCCGYSVSRDPFRQERLLLISEWDNKDAAVKHMQTGEFKLFEETTRALGGHCTIELVSVLSHFGRAPVGEEIASSLLSVSDDEVL